MSSVAEIKREALPNADLAKLRGRERVIRHLLHELGSPHLHVGYRLPTNRELANQLDVSVRTVHVAKQRLAAQGHIRTRKGSGTFLAAKPAEKPKALRLAISIPLSLSAVGGDWIYRTSSGILHAALRAKPSILLSPLPEEVEGTDAAVEKLLSLRSEVNGLILFPYSLHPAAARDRVCAAYERDGKPVVHYYPPTETSTADFVSFDYFEASRRLADAWRATGRSRFLFLNGGPTRGYVSHSLRHLGFVSGLGSALGNECSLRVVEPKERLEQPGEDFGYHAMRQAWKQSKTRPDAVFCATDEVAFGVMQFLEEQGVRVPEQVSVAAGSGMNVAESAFPQLTCLRQPLEKMGEELVALFCERIKLGGASLPGRLLPIRIVCGKTTRAEENVLLEAGEIAEAQPGSTEDEQKQRVTITNQGLKAGAV